jgi:hydrogenase maturation factor HypF (carbamoyltransferase family)
MSAPMLIFESLYAEIERLKVEIEGSRRLCQVWIDKSSKQDKLITELAAALEIYGTMYPGTPLKELIQRAREATR